MAGGFCVRCGQPLAADARFCIRCGTPVAGGATPVAGGGAPQAPGRATVPPTQPGRRQSFLRGPWGVLLIVAVVIVVVVVALATIPVDHSLDHSISVSGAQLVTDVWTWTFPSGTHVTVAWTGSAGTSTNLTVLGPLAALINVSGPSGTFWFTAAPFPYLFEATVNGPGSVLGSVDFTASYRAPIL